MTSTGTPTSFRAVRRLSVAALVWAVAVSLFACPSPEPEHPDAGVDGGVDGGTSPRPNGGRDAGSDGGSDAGRDAGHDGGATDGGADAGTQRIGWGNLQWPPFVTSAPGQSVAAYGQVWIDGVTPAAGAASGLEVELGRGPSGESPESAAWTWSPAVFHKDVGNNDEWTASLVAPAEGVFDYAFRYRFAQGPWLYGDRSDDGRLGSDDGFQSLNAGRLAVRSPGGVVRIATLNLHCLNDTPTARLDAAAARLSALQVDVVALQEVCVDASPSAAFQNSAAYLAQKLSSAERTFSHRFAQTHLSFNTIPEGLGLVFALPLARAWEVPLPVADFPRKAHVGVFASPVGMLAVASTHLSFRQEDAQARIDQANAIVQAMDALDPAAIPLAVVAGDFNTTPEQTPITVMTAAGFIDAWAALFPDDPGFTHRSDNPTRRIDYLFVRDDASTPVSLSSVTREFTVPYAPGAWVSDHIGVVVELRLPGP